MPGKQLLNTPRSERSDERGAALISVLLIATLLLSAGGVLLLTTSMSATNPLDTAAEMQAYYAAEAGLQRTLNVARTNDIPAGTMPAGRIELTFRDIVLNPTLANWLPFDGPAINGASTTVVGTNAFSVLVTDPDDQGPVLLRKINTIPTYQPSRINVQLTGYGPKRARKVLNMIVVRAGLGSFQAPATITLRGSDAAPPPSLNFATGDSAQVRYTGNDAAGGAGISAFAVTVPDVAPTLLGIEKPGQIEGSPVSVLGPTSPFPDIPPTPTPEWLETADNARAFLAELQRNAVEKGRYFTHKPQASDMGTPGAPKFTFVDGDVHFGGGDGGTGLLVVTGSVSMVGNSSFNGIILVLGEGSVDRNGAGSGLISGGIVVAKFGATGGFSEPTFTTNGGGNSRIQYDSSFVAEAAALVPGFLVLGVVEK